MTGSQLIQRSDVLRCTETTPHGFARHILSAKATGAKRTTYARAIRAARCLTQVGSHASPVAQDVLTVQLGYFMTSQGEQ